MIPRTLGLTASGRRAARLLGGWSRHNAAWLIGGEACNRAGRFLLLIIIAREVGVSDFGPWVIAVATGTVLANVGDLGLTSVVTSRVAAHPSRARADLARVLAVAPLLACLGFALVLALGPLLAQGRALLLLVTLAGGGALESAAFLLLAPLRGSGQTRPEGLVRGFQGCALLIAGVLVLRLTNSQAATALAFPVVGIASVAFTVKMAIAAFGIARPRWDAGWLRQSLRPAVPIFASTLIFFLYFRVDAYLLAYLKGSAATGTYGAAYNLAFGVTFIPLMFGRAVMPRIAAANGPAPLRDAIRPSVAVSAALGVGLAVLLGAVTPVIPIAYGPSFDGATQPYVLLIVAQALFCISHVCAITLVARERGVALWGATLVALAVNVTANLALIPRLGAAGAALAMVISETAFLSTLAWFVRSLVLQPTAGAAGLPARPAPVSPREAA